MQSIPSLRGSRSARALTSAFLLVVVFAGMGRGVEAAGPVTRTWTGAGANNNWTTQANWNPAAPNAGDILVFSSRRCTSCPVPWRTSVRNPRSASRSPRPFSCSQPATNGWHGRTGCASLAPALLGREQQSCTRRDDATPSQPLQVPQYRHPAPPREPRRATRCGARDDGIHAQPDNRP